MYYYSTSTYDKWRKLNVPCVQPIPLFGNSFKMLTLSENQNETLNRIYQKFPSAKICGFYQMMMPILMVRDPELINRILTSDFSYFTDRGLYLDPESNLLANVLFFMTGRKWRTLRQKLSPGFTIRKIKGTYDQIKECSQQLVSSIDEKLKQTDVIEVKEIIKYFASDVIGTCAFGLKLDTIKNRDSDFRKYVSKLLGGGLSQSISHLILTFFPKIGKFLKLQIFPRDAFEFFHSVFCDVIKYRTENNVVRNDLTQTLLEAREELVLNGDSTGDDNEGIR